MTGITSKLTGFGKRTVAASIAGVVLTAVPAVALAGGHSDYYHRDRDGHGDVRVDLSIPIGHTWERVPPPVCTERIWVEPVYRTVCEQRWIEPAYRTVCERVWRPVAVQKTNERVWAPDRYEWRDVVRYEHGRRCTAREYVLVDRGHWEDRCREVVIPAHYEDVQRQELVCAGHWENVERQELVCAGHWEDRPVVVAGPVYREEPRARIDLHFPIRW